MSGPQLLIDNEQLQCRPAFNYYSFHSFSEHFKAHKRTETAISVWPKKFIFEPHLRSSSVVAAFAAAAVEEGATAAC